jgi:peptidoglycan/xylan/chitin deacetylase (PgdA/CDA1 family)
MLNYQNVNRAALFILLALLAADQVYGISLPAYGALCVVYTALYFYGAFTIQANFFIASRGVLPGANAAKEIALTFDDGPGDYTAEILNILKVNRIKAAFFCVGKNMQDRQALMKQMDQEGHLIGNHSFSHHNLFDFFSCAKIYKELQTTDNLTVHCIGKRPCLFRPPYGVTLPWLARAIDKGGYSSIGWTVRSYDTVIDDKNRLFRRITNALHPGAVYLFHDTRAVTAAVLPAFIDQVTASGYRIVRVDEMLQLPAYR